MNLRILGCGTSSGVPRIGNDWGSCDPADPRNRRTRSALLVDSGEERLLVDCGPDLREQLLAAGGGPVTGVIVTHAHADHCHGIDDLRQVFHQLGYPVPFYARGDTLDLLQARFAYVFKGTQLYPPVLEPNRITGDMTVGHVTLRFTDQPHGRITSLGIRFDTDSQSAVYATDFNTLSDDMASLYQGTDVWICDCLRRTPHPTHANLDDVLGWARDLKIGQLLLTHLDNSMDYATLAGELPDWAAPAFDGQEILLQ